MKDEFFHEHPALSKDLINTLPEDVRHYIAWIETNADPAQTLQENYRLTMDNKALCRKLDAVLAKLEDSNMTNYDNRMQEIYDRLERGGDFTVDDYEAVVDYFAEDIPYGIQKGRDGTVDDWFFRRWEELTR